MQIETVSDRDRTPDYTSGFESVIATDFSRYSSSVSPASVAVG